MANDWDHWVETYNWGKRTTQVTYNWNSTVVYQTWEKNNLGATVLWIMVMEDFSVIHLLTKCLLCLLYVMKVDKKYKDVMKAVTCKFVFFFKDACKCGVIY